MTPPSSRLGRKAWAQIKCTAKRVLARAWDGDEITNSYSVGGRGIIRIVTEDGNFDHEFDFNLEISEIPF